MGWLPDSRCEPRYETIDAWRGVACLMVVLSHAGFALKANEGGNDVLRWPFVWAVQHSYLGVPLFFVISGYCIAASVDALRRRGHSPWTFLARRVRRIYPPYWAAILIFAATTAGLDHIGQRRLHGGDHSLRLESPGALDRAQWLGNATLTETWRPKVWGGRESLVFTRVAWSLCHEEQFYFACFLVLLAAPRRPFAALAIISAATMAYRSFAYDSGAVHRLEGTFPYYWHEFAVGVAVYWRLVKASTPLQRRVAEAGIATLMAIGLATDFTSTWVAAVFGLALIGLRRFDGASTRATWLAPLRACGRRSYSIYLVHNPVCLVGIEWLYSLGMVGFWVRALVMIPVLSVAAVVFGWAFFEVVEARFLNPPVDRRPHTRPIAGEAAIEDTAASELERSIV